MRKAFAASVVVLSLYADMQAQKFDYGDPFTVFDGIMKITEPPVRPESRDLLKRGAARGMVFEHAKAITGSGNPRDADIVRALKSLDSVYCAIADKYAGNQDGKCQPRETVEMDKTMKNYSGGSEVIGMMRKYGVRNFI